MIKTRCDLTLKRKRPGSPSFLWLAALALTAAALSLAVIPALADGGGWPTATPTTVLLVVTPQVGKDVLPVSPTATLQAAVPAADSQGVLPAESIQADQSNVAPAPPAEAAQSRSINWRMLLIGGGLVLGVLLALFLFMRLRA